MARIETKHGEMDESQLVKKIVTHEREKGISVWIEYYLGDELVRRDIHNRPYSIDELQARVQAKEKGANL